MRPDPATHPDSALRSRFLGIRWPLFFQAAPKPPASSPVMCATSTTPAQFTWRVILAAKHWTLPAGVLQIISQVAATFTPVIAGLAIDHGVRDGNARTLTGWLVVLAVVVVAGSLIGRTGSRMGLYGMQQVQHRLRMQVTDRLLDPAGMADRRLGGALLSVATSDVFRLAAAMQLLVYPVGQIAAVLAAGVILLVIAWPLGLAILLGTPALLWLMTVAGRPLQRRSQVQQRRVAAATGQAADLITGYRVIKGLRAEDVSADRYRTVSATARDGAVAVHGSRGVYLGAMGAVSAVFLAALTVSAAGLALGGHLTVGQLISVVGVLQFLMGPLNGLGNSIGTTWATAVSSAGRVLTVLNADVARTGGSACLPGAPVAVTVHCDPPLTVAAGECLGVRSSGPAARELMASLSDGRVTLVTENSTVSGTDLPVEVYRRTVLTPPHTADLADATLAENLTAGGSADDGGVGDGVHTGERVDRALYASASTDILDGLPDGLDSRVGEGGTRLSGGQRQRIALARALTADAPVLVLHDPTTAVDAVTEHTIAGRLPGARDDRMTIIITESAALLAACDRVVDL
ncbi:MULTISPECIES: ABC transporter transmembrane domain-containing protein [Corynebacterium]|uniref:ABC transport system permease protein / ATP-binding protein n=2 Tax=Corynebacterium variabile TaxID=1727 RepID=G0HH42_CORVD|nr:MULTISPECIES: ABC transporter ATP-binding protein [Corynebacterium]AEK38192.1 ABC transport system permease protein / ATP-binding protein [Corynebacterium variabile DSM 44702]MDN5722741.1 ABC transporter ATP-binding protein/permease [Corynebacterium sp.]MDN6283115.1 ABC transporter ATP-binding protein/permease [Corynebacterium sp.]MDN6306032.1 ABC transporter ATP-binding protein/permease [Corynebacterium sp.]MDN6351810.1 ABC transporter ATP-binding protein/permease [Corynebacterium sp.]